MKPGSTKRALALTQHSKFIEAIEKCGGEAFTVPYVYRAYDSVFMKDNAILVDSHLGRRAFLARPATPERAMEPIARAEHLRELGFEIAGQSEAMLEGGDVVLSPLGNHAFLGYGFRSSRQAEGEVARFLGVEVTSLRLVDPYFYHLDTAFNLIVADGRQIALIYPEAFSFESRQKLNFHPLIDEVISVPRDEALNLALNWVEINGTIVFGGGAPVTKTILESFGKIVVTRELDQFKMAGGSAACLVAQVHRLNLNGH